MRNYAKVTSSIWTGATGRRLRGDPEAQLVAFYLMTAPSSTMDGLYYLPLSTIAHDTGLSLKAVSKAMKRLIDLGFTQYDKATELVWVIRMAAFQIAETLESTDKRVIGIRRDLERYRDTPFYGAFVQRYGQAFHLHDDDGNLGGPSKGLPRSSEGASSGQEGPSEALRSQEQEHEQEHEQEQKPRKGRIAPSGWEPPPAAPAAKADVQLVTDRYHDKFRARTGMTPVITPKQLKLVEEIVRQLGARTALALVNQMFVSQDPWYDRVGRTIEALYSTTNKLLEELGRNGAISARTARNIEAAQAVLSHRSWVPLGKTEFLNEAASDASMPNGIGTE